MAQADYPPRDRLSLRAYIRARLQGRGLLEFADDDEEARVNTELVYMNCGQQWREDALGERTQLELQALMATTTDNPMQGVGNTVLANDEFWSSTGSSSGSAGDSLLYRLTQPLGRLAYVSVAVYRANYQHGDPLYPSRKVSFLTGPTPNQLYPASPVYPVRLTDEQQVFALAPTAAVSQYLMVRLHGRMQRQWEDLQFYIAIRHVAAYGDPMDPAYCFQIARLSYSGGLAWPATRGLVSAAAGGDAQGLYDSAVRGAGTGAGARGSAAFPTSTPLSGGRQGAGGEPPAPGAPGAVEAQGGEQVVVSEDVYEAGPLSLEEERRMCVSIAYRRGALRSGRTAALESSEVAAVAVAGALPRGAGGQVCCPVRRRAVLPSGPTEAELRQAVQQAGLARALHHLVHMPWGEVLVARKPHQLHQNAQHPQQPNQLQLQHQQHSGAQGASAAGRPAGGACQAATNEDWYRRPGAEVHRGQPAAGGGAAARPFFGLQRTPNHICWRNMSHEADAEEQQEEVGDGGGSGSSSGAAMERPGSSVGPLQRLRAWLTAAARGGGGGRGRVGAGNTDSERTSSRGSSAGGSSATSGTSGSGDGGGRDALHGATAASRYAELLALRSPAPAGDVIGMALLAEFLHSVAFDRPPGAAGLAGDAAARAGTSAAAAMATAVGARAGALRHSRPAQALPPPKLRRRGSGGAAAAAGMDGGKGTAEVTAAYGRAEGQQRRRRQQQRAVQRAMQPAVYCPVRSNRHLFVALEAWAGMGGGVAAFPFSCGDAGCHWLVSHYDHEHL